MRESIIATLCLLISLLEYSQKVIMPPKRQANSKLVLSTSKSKTTTVMRKVQVSQSKIVNGTCFTINGVTFDVISVIGSNFQMGNNDSEVFPFEKLLIENRIQCSDWKDGGSTCFMGGYNIISMTVAVASV